MLEITPTSPYYRDIDKVNQFYFESWALVHYLTFGPGMEGGGKLDEFFAELQDGVDQEKAFQQVFGNLAQVENRLDDSMRQVGFRAGVVPETNRTD